MIKKDSQRLELLEPFSNHFFDSTGNKVRTELPALKVLARIRGKCTTDHISAAVSLSYLSNSQTLYAHTLDRALGSSTKAISRIYLKTYVITYSSRVRVVLNLILFLLSAFSDYCTYILDRCPWAYD